MVFHSTYSPFSFFEDCLSRRRSFRSRSLSYPMQVVQPMLFVFVRYTTKFLAGNKSHLPQPFRRKWMFIIRVGPTTGQGSFFPLRIHFIPIAVLAIIGAPIGAERLLIGAFDELGVATSACDHGSHLGRFGCFVGHIVHVWHLCLIQRSSGAAIKAIVPFALPLPLHDRS